MDLVGMNVAELLLTANYVDILLPDIQARDYYQSYIDDRTFVSSVSNSRKTLKSRKYYDQAQLAIGYFEDILPNYTNSTLPAFPKFGEVEKNALNLGELGYITSDMADYLSGESSGSST